MSIVQCYSPNYFSTEDIMVTQERLPCKTEIVLLRLGFLNVGSDKDDVEPGTNLELPFWLTQSLRQHQRRVVTVDIPKAYKEKTRDIFEADAKVVDLFRVNPHFYEFGCYLINFNHRESDLIQSVIVQTFKERFRVIMDWADNIMTEPTKIQQLDCSEKSLLKAGHRARSQLDSWLTEGIRRMKASDMVINLKKRKLIDTDS